MAVRPPGGRSTRTSRASGKTPGARRRASSSSSNVPNPNLSEDPMADPRKLSIKKPAQRNPLLDNLPQSSFGAPQQSQAATPPPAQPGVTGTLPLRADRPVALSTAAVGTI